MSEQMKKVVIAGSASLSKEIESWVNFWNRKTNCKVVDWPSPIEKTRLLTEYPKVHKEFFQNLANADIVFIANENKNGIEGYIGAETFAELTFAVTQNIVYDKNIEIILAKMPSKEVQSHEEVQMWLKLGWLEVMKANTIERAYNKS